MIKYVNTQVVFREIPNEITLAINISNCPCNCKGCHSPYLSKDIGKILNWYSINNEEGLMDIILKNIGITCVAFMGGDNDPSSINYFANKIKWYNNNVDISLWTPLKVAWYSGRQKLYDKINLDCFDYIKLGPYIEKLGPLDNKTTNQRLYKVINEKLIDITYKFWRNG